MLHVLVYRALHPKFGLLLTQDGDDLTSTCTHFVCVKRLEGAPSVHAKVGGCQCTVAKISEPYSCKGTYLHLHHVWINHGNTRGARLVST
jgi:hypothetical protein